MWEQHCARLLAAHKHSWGENRLLMVCGGVKKTLCRQMLMPVFCRSTDVDKRRRPKCELMAAVCAHLWCQIMTIELLAAWLESMLVTSALCFLLDDTYRAKCAGSTYGAVFVTSLDHRTQSIPTQHQHVLERSGSETSCSSPVCLPQEPILMQSG